MFLWFPVLDLARAPRRTARKKGSGYENEREAISYPEPSLSGSGYEIEREGSRDSVVSNFFVL